MLKAPGTIVPGDFHKRFHIVLVEPADNLNIGSVCRAMRNLGFSNLHLVRPRQYDKAKARVTACWAEDLLESVVIHDDFEAALSNMEDVVGFSTREGKNRSMHMVLDDWLTKELPSPPPVTALVFGPEDSGLRQEHTALCRCLVRIPSTENCPAYNLAQSALLILYQLSSGRWGELKGGPEKKLPTGVQFQQLDRLIEEVLTTTKYYRAGTPEPVPDLVRSLFRRINPDEREMRVLLGIFSRVQRTFDLLKDKLENSKAEK